MHTGSSPSSPQMQPVLLHRQSTAHHEFNPYNVYDASASTSHSHMAQSGHAPQLSLSGSGTSLMGGVAPMPNSNSFQPAPIRAFPGIPSPDGRIPSVEEQLSEKRRLRSEQRKNSNPPLAANGYFVSSHPNSRRTSPSPGRTSAADLTNNTSSSGGGRQSGERTRSTDSLGNLTSRHRRGSSSNDMSAMNASMRSEKAPRLILQNHHRHEGDDNGSDDGEDGEGGTNTPFLTMRTRQSLDDMIANVPGARKPTQKDRENPPPMYFHNTAASTTSPIRSPTSPPQPQSPQ